MFEIQKNISISASAHAGFVYTDLTLQELPVWLHFMHCFSFTATILVKQKKIFFIVYLTIFIL